MSNVSGFEDGGRSGEGLRVVFSPKTLTGMFTKMTASNIENAHTLTLEFYGANGGIFRYFPRGRPSMPLTFRLNKAGSTSYYVTARDKQFDKIGLCRGIIDVVDFQPDAQASIMETPDQEIGAGHFEDAPVLEAMGKPPLAEIDQDARAGEPSQRLSAYPSASSDIGKALQDRIESRLLGRFDKT